MVLEASGSSLDKVVKTTVFSANAAYFGLINEIYREYFPKEFPARTFVTVGSWPSQFDIEIECIAIAGSPYSHDGPSNMPCRIRVHT